MENKRIRSVSKLAAIVGENIVRRRKTLGLSQEQFAEKLQIGADSLSRIENGVTAPRYTRLEEIAFHLDCHVSDLFREETAPLEVKLNALEDIMASLPADVQNDLLRVMLLTAETFKKNCLR